MHKTLLLLGLLRHKALYGYELHRIVRAHGELYADLKKANLYYLLERLAKDGDLDVQTEPGTRGARGERVIYSLTAKGLAHFNELLRDTLRNYEAVHTGIEVAIVLLRSLPTDEAIALLEERRQGVSDYRIKMVAELGTSDQSSVLAAIAADHMLSLIDAELAWLDRSLTQLRESGWESNPSNHDE